MINNNEKLIFSEGKFTKKTVAANFIVLKGLFNIGNLLC